MNVTAINIIKYLAFGDSDVQTLMNITKIKESQINLQLKNLTLSGYITRKGNTVKLTNELEPTIIRELTKKINIENILRGANETIFSYLTEPTSINKIVLKSKLSPATVYKAIRDFGSVGAIIRDGDKIKVNDSIKQLVLLAALLNAKQKNLFESNAEILFKDSTKTFRKVQQGELTKGRLTGFSRFTEFEIEYHVLYDYYIEQDTPLDLEHVLIHAVYDAQRDKNKQAMIMCVIFYLKHKEKIDISNLRKIAETFQIAHVWIDVEGYIRNSKLKNPTLFLPKNEFIEKADLYDIPTSLYVLPERYPKLFEKIGKNLQRKTKAFLIGGENMRIKGLKVRTKDIDIVVENQKDFNSIKNALTKLGYKPKGNVNFSTEDFRLHPSTIMEHTNRSRIDLFTKKILKTLSLSSKMISRAELADFSNLHLGILKNEDIFLLKSITSREGDIQDMASLIDINHTKKGKFTQIYFNWDIVWNEIKEQEKKSPLKSFSEIMQDNIEWLAQYTSINIPIRNKLQRVVLDRQIKKLLQEGLISIKKVVELLVDENNSEQDIRNRIDSLVKIGLVKKEFQNNEILIRFLNNPVYPENTLKVTFENLEPYLQWRFPTREGATLIQLELVANNLATSGYETIDKIDNIINKMLDKFHEYEKKYYQRNKKFSPKDKIKQIDAMRICIELLNPEFGKNDTNDFGFF